jgi:alanyl-tRNA synthetase
LPLEISRDIAREDGLEVEIEGFNEALADHRFASGAGAVEGALSDEDTAFYRALLEDLKATGALGAEGVFYDPYAEAVNGGPLLAIVSEGRLVEAAEEGDRVKAVVPSTNFYIEAGGQVSDTGELVSSEGNAWRIEVGAVYRPVEGLILHEGVVTAGTPKRGDVAHVRYDRVRRWDIMRNHTATHLLHTALQQILGEHARQAGSLVAPDRLRFDFTHPKALSEEEIDRLESFVNRMILANYDLRIEHKDREDALAEGAMALFGETYGDQVRTVAIGEPEKISFELCGGTHVPETGVIGPFFIVGEGSVAAGIRRVEAITGRAALDLIQRQRKAIENLSEKLSVTPDSVEARVEQLLEEYEKVLRGNKELHYRLAEVAFDSQEVELVDGVSLVRAIIPDVSMDTLRSLTDRFRSKTSSGVVVLATVQEGKPLIVAAITRDLTERGMDADDLVKKVASRVGGGGGGKPTLAQAGGNDPNKLPEALEIVEEWVRSRLS